MEGNQEGNQVKAGDVFYTSWGYDQTNYDYIVVKSVSPTGKTAVCQRASHENMGYGCQANIQRPTTEGFGDEFRMQVQNASLRGSYPFCGTGTGSKRLGTFWQWDGKRNFEETDPMFGH